MPKWNYMTKQPDITFSMRSILVSTIRIPFQKFLNFLLTLGCSQSSRPFKYYCLVKIVLFLG